jgi:hypothetical protein
MTVLPLGDCIDDVVREVIAAHVQTSEKLRMVVNVVAGLSEVANPLYSELC